MSINTKIQDDDDLSESGQMPSSQHIQSNNQKAYPRQSFENELQQPQKLIYQQDVNDQVQIDQNLQQEMQKPLLGQQNQKSEKKNQKPGQQNFTWYNPQQFMTTSFANDKKNMKKTKKSNQDANLLQATEQNGQNKQSLSSSVLIGEEGREKTFEERQEDLERDDLLQFRDLNAREFLNRIAFDINLNSLYTIHAASNFNNFEKYVAIILRLGHHMRSVQMDNEKTEIFKSDQQTFLDDQNNQELIDQWNTVMQEIQHERGRIKDEKRKNPLALLASDSTPTYVTEKCFSTIFFLLKGYMPRWSVVRNYIQNEIEEFIDQFMRINLDDLPASTYEWVLEFCQDPECSLLKCGNELKVVRVFSKWLHILCNLVNLKMSNESKLNPPYLLQIWSNKGQCVYERPMDETIKRWNLFDNTLLFMQDDSVVVAIECGETKYDTVIRDFIFQQSSFKSPDRPDKKDFSNDYELPKRQIGLYKDKIIFITDQVNGSNEIVYTPIDIKSDKAFINVPLEDAHKLRYPYGKLKWHMCCDEGDGEMLMIAEDLKNNNQLLFFNLVENAINTDKLQLERQGLIKDVINKLGKPIPPIKDLIVNFNTYKQTFKNQVDQQAQEQEDQKVCNDGQTFMTCLALREDNIVSTFADCAHIQTWEVDIHVKDQEHNVIGTEINSDGIFYMIKVTSKFKILNKDPNTQNKAGSEQDTSDINQALNLLKSRISGRHNISKTQFSKCNSLRKNTCALNSRIQDYYRLYSGMLNIGTYYLISHRNCVSLYDLRQNQTNYQYCETITFKSHIKGLCQYDFGQKNNINARDDFISSVVAITEDNQIHFLHLQNRQIIKSSKEMYIPGKNARIQEDQFCQSGIYFLNSDNEFYVYSGMDQIQEIDISKYHTITGKTNITCMPVDKEVFNQDNSKGHESNWQDIMSSTTLTKEVIYQIKSKVKLYSVINSLKFSTLFIETEDRCSVFIVQREPYITNDQKTNGFQIQLHHVVSFRKHEKDQDSLLDTIAISGNCFPTYVGWYIRFSQHGFAIYNKVGKMQVLFENISIAEVKHMSEYVFIALIKGSMQKVKAKVPDPYHQERLIEINKEDEIVLKYDALYCIDIGALLQSKKLISFKLIEATIMADPAASNLVDYCSISQRLGFLNNENKLKIIPFPQSNVTYFAGMDHKSEYIMWRQKNGFFSALNKKGTLFTWSMITGNLLYSRPASDFRINVEGYEPHQADDNDTLYYSNKYQLRHSTIQLLQQKTVQDQDQEQEDDQYGDDKVLNQLKQVQHRFKVLQMQLHQDRTEDSYQLCGEEKVKELFNFKFTLQEKRDRNDLRQGEAENRMFLSQNTKFIMLIQQGYTAEFYSRDEPDSKNEVRWTLQFRQDQFGEALQQQFSFNFLYSPNFQYYLTFKFNEKKFIIKSTEFAEKSFQLEIPQDLFRLQDSEEDVDTEWVQKKCQSFHFLSEEYFRLVNKEGIDCLFSFRSGTLKIENSFKRVNYSSQHAKGRHLFLDETWPKGEDTLSARLRKRCTEMRYSINQQQFWETQRHWKGADSPDDIQDVNELMPLHNVYFNCRKVLNNCFKVDCSQTPVLSDSSFYVCESTFTIANWILMDFLAQGEDDGYQSIPDDLFLRLFFNIQPSGDQFIHMLVSKDDQTNISIMNRGFTLAKSQDMELPIQYNNLGITPFDYVLNIKNKDFKIFQQPIIISERNDKEDQMKKAKKLHASYENLTAANKLFDLTKDYGYMNLGHMITKAVVQAVKRELPNIGEFMTCRCLKSQHQPSGMQFGVNFSNKSFSENFAREPAKLLNGDDVCTLVYGVVEQPLWAQETVTKTNLFKTKGLKKKMRTFYFDIPFLHKRGVDGFQMIKALSETEDKKIFRQFPVQALVNYHWERTKIWFMLFTLLPFSILISSYTYWTFVLIQRQINADKDSPIEFTFRLIVMICAGFFLSLEIKQFLNIGMEYFSDFWNYLELTPLISIFYMSIVSWQHAFDGVDEFSQGFYIVQGYTAFFVWMKLLFFMRLFSKTGYLVYSVFAVMSDMLSFLFIFAVVIVAFNFTFISLQFRCSDGDGCLDIQDFTFLYQFKRGFLFIFNVTIGNDSYNADDPAGQIAYVLCVVTLVIMMLNILIAIVSNSFQKILDNEVVYTFSERCSMIREYQILLGRFYFMLEKQQSPSDLLFFACEDEDVLADKWFSESTQSVDRQKRESEEDRVQNIHFQVKALSTELEEQKRAMAQKFEENKTNLRISMEEMVHKLDQIKRSEGEQWYKPY